MKNIINWFLHEDGHLDWLKHMILGTLFFALSLFVMIVIQDDVLLSLTASMFATVFAGLGRELYNQYVQKKSASAHDILNTIIVPLIISIVIIVLLIIKDKL